MKKFHWLLGILLCSFLLISTPSCKKKSYPCPGLGQSSEADFSLFDENGQLKDTKGKKKKRKDDGKRIDHQTGYVKKKSPKQIRKPVKKHL